MWQDLQAPEGKLYTWDESSTYIHNPPFFAKMKIELDVIKNITNAHCLLNVGYLLPQITFHLLEILLKIHQLLVS